jgi:hypothetical protein
MAAALEEQVLNVLGRAAATWDGLRAELGATPGELDSAIRRLELSRQVTRDRGRFHLHGVTASTPVIAQATIEEPSVPKQTAADEASSAPTEKRCKGRCNSVKPLDDFHKNAATPDGHASECKACKAAVNKEYRLRKAGKPPSVPRPAQASIDRHNTTVATGPTPATQAPVAPVVILHFADGVRIGPLVTSVAGVAQMPFHVDLSAAQVGELVTWWSKATRENQL